MSPDELTRLYAFSLPGTMPDGDSLGMAIILPGTRLGGILSSIANYVWKGKVLDRQRGRVVNKILGRHLVKAQLFAGPSWRDGKESIIIDYRRTSFVAFFIRDEIRLAEPGVYLGRCYFRLPFGKRCFVLYFALDFRG